MSNATSQFGIAAASIGICCTLALMRVFKKRDRRRQTKGFSLRVCQRKELGKKAARFVLAELAKVIEKKGSARVIFATGNSQLKFIQALVHMPSDLWKHVTAFHLDEYVGLPASHPASFRRYLRERLFEKLPFSSVHYLDPTQPTSAYEKLLLEGPIDIACIGIGENGHIAFNDPPVADFEDKLMVKRVELDAACRKQQVGEGWFESLDTTPTHAITLTIPAIMRAAVISCVVPDERKARAVRDMMSLAKPETKVPASILRTHKHCVLWLDGGSASLLPSC